MRSPGCCRQGSGTSSIANHCQRSGRVHVHNSRSKLSEELIFRGFDRGRFPCRATQPRLACRRALPKLARPLSIPELLRHLIRIERKTRGRRDLVSVWSAQETVTIGRTHPPSPARNRGLKALAPHPIELT